MAYPDGFLDELRNRVGLAELVGRHVRLTRRGREYVGLCPFHHEKTSSFTVNEDKGFFHCFGCGAHGSVFDFVMRIDGVGFSEAVARLAPIAGMALPADTPEERERAKRRQSLFEVNEAAASHYEKMLRMPEGRTALDYLRRRGLADGAIARFRLGYAPDGRSSVRTALARDGIDEALMIEAGLLILPEDRTRGAYDRFRDRVIFPIRDRERRIVGFGGRLLASGEPKYLNTPETPLFHKGHLLYNLDGAWAAARGQRTVIVVEGYMDVISLCEAGFDAVVAPLGTALTADQLALMWSLAPEPVLCFDPDAAGQRAAIRAAERAMPLLRPELGLRFAFLRTATGDDPDVVARRYPRQFIERAIAEAASLSDLIFSVETSGRSLHTAETRAAVEVRLKQRLAAIPDPRLRAHFEAAFRQKLWQAARPARAQKGERRQSQALPPVAGVAPRLGTERNADAEKTMLAILLRHPEYFHTVEEEVGSTSLAQPALDSLRQALLRAMSGAATMTAATLRQLLTGQGLGDVIDAVLDDPIIRRRTAKEAADASSTDITVTWTACMRALRRLQDPEGRTPSSDDPSDAEMTIRLRERQRALQQIDEDL
jgi:DNA primase